MARSRRPPTGEEKQRALARSIRAAEQLEANELAVTRHAAEVFRLYEGECRRRACRRARACIGPPFESGRLFYPKLLPPCVPCERYEPLRRWLDDTYWKKIRERGG